MPLKNVYTLVYGFNLFATNSIFLDLIKELMSVLKTASPKDTFLNSSLVIFLTPVLVVVPVFVTVSKSSLII